MFNLKERGLFTYWCFVYWRKDCGVSDAYIIIFMDENPDPEMMESCLPDENLYHTEIVKITTADPILNSDCGSDTLGTGCIYETPNGDYAIVLDNAIITVVGLKIIK